jgi:hypothetical protein
MESQRALPFRKLSNDIYLTLEVLKYLEINEAATFMQSLNKHAREYISENFVTVKNAFVNEGLIEL